MSQVVLSSIVRQTTGSVAIIALEGLITADAEDAIVEALEHAAGNEAKSMVLDFSKVAGMDSGGASVLVKLWVSSEQRRMRLAAAGPNGQLREVLELTGLKQVMTVCGNLSQALSAKGASADVTARETKRFEVTIESPMGTSRGEASHWARPLEKLRITKVPGSISGLNVEGRHPVGPIKGFGPMWEKTYELRFSDVKKTPFEIAATAKKNFVRFQPPQNNFYPTPAGIVAGETVLIRSAVMGIPILTGVLVSYADDVSFTFMTPQGHPESGWVTFRVFREVNETICQIQGLARASDPIYEIAFRLHGSRFQEMTWRHVLGSLAKYLDVNVPVTMKKRCVAPNLQWSQVGNIRHNAQLWTLAYLLAWPIRRLVQMLRR